MRKFIGQAAIVAAMLTLCAACQDNRTADEGFGLSDKEKSFKAAMQPYIDHTVVPTYKGMADNAIALSDACNDIYGAFLGGSLTSDKVAQAGDLWKACRKYWEQSEAFLYGAASDYKIDPHIDSWPLDKNAMEQLLSNIRKGQEWSVDLLGFGLLGFHSVEYMLFELSADGRTSLPHSLSYSDEELQYLCAVAEDLRNYCVYLYASWAGDVNSSYASILEEAELESPYCYGWGMINAGQAGSRYKTYQEAAEDLVQGCIDIADEVGNVKIGTPNKAESESDRNYIESPYSLNSITDFVDNIISIRRCYLGSEDGDASISDYVKSWNPDLDTRVRNMLDKAVEAISAIPEPFALYATSAAADNAVSVVGTDLVNVLEEVYSGLSRE
ncbi:MAG: imelysin family protein [Candidatus Cryptobacteroides sp.]